MKLVLSVDGGGIRGLIPALLLRTFAERLAAAGDQRPFCQVFDLMAGTSTGGIIVAGLACPHPEDGRRPACTPAELVRLYREDGKKIFSRDRFRGLREALLSLNPGAVVQEKYDFAEIEAALQERLGIGRLQDALTRVALTAYDIEARETRVMTNDPADDVYLFWQAARATSAAPVYFEPARAKNFTKGRIETLVDGGVFVNDPALIAYTQARRCFPDDPDVAVISLGTGTATRPYEHRRVRNWGPIAWADPRDAVPILSIMMHGQAHATQRQLEILLKDRYIRIDAPLDAAMDDMDDASETNLRALEAMAQEMIAAQHEKVDRIVALMRAHARG